MTTVYKVVLQTPEGALTSVFTTGKWKRHYRIGRTHKGRYDTPLLAFSNLEDTNFWKGLFEGWSLPGSLVVFECKATGERKVQRILDVNSMLLSYSTFWSLLENAPLYTFYTMTAPEGTVACDTVKLVREV